MALLGLIKSMSEIDESEPSAFVHFKDGEQPRILKDEPLMIQARQVSLFNPEFNYSSKFSVCFGLRIEVDCNFELLLTRQLIRLRWSPTIP